MFSHARVFVWLIFATFGCLSQFGSTPVGAEEAWRQWIDAKTCTETLPYIQMSKDVYGDEAGPEIPQGWRRLDNWEAVFRKAGSANLIEDAKASGFYAAVYRNVSDKSHTIGEIAIIYRGTEGLNDWKGWKTNFDAWRGKVPVQYEYAVTFAQRVKKLYPNVPVTAAGHSKVGGQATYASQQTLGIHKVITINSARPPFVDHPNRRVTQINVIVPGEVIGDPKSGLPIGGLLPGKYFGVKYIDVKSTTDRPTLIKAGVPGIGDAISAAKVVYDGHGVEAVIVAVREVLNPKPSAAPSVSMPSTTAPRESATR
jgi:Mbeg1-like